MKFKMPVFSKCALLYILFISACTPAPAPLPTPILLPSFAPAPTATSNLPTSTGVVTSTPGPDRTSVWLSPGLPVGLSNTVTDNFGLTPSSEKSASNCTLDAGNQNRAGSWTYALVAPFNTFTDNVEQNGFVEKWKNHSADFSASEILMDQESLDFISSKLGNPDPLSVKIIPQPQMLQEAWKTQKSWAIIPFDQLEPQWKVISIDNINPLHKQFDPLTYLLSIPFSINCKLPLEKTANLPAYQITNRDPKSLTTIIMTGVTAMVRGTAYAMETKGIDYPATDIRDILREADFTHISNEIPYWPKCPPPFFDPGEKTLHFCSAPKYNQLLEDVGADIIELSGDHFNDWGPDAMIYTLDLYKKAGMQYYGGGYNLEDGRKPLLIEHNGNKIAFLGCNAKPPGYGTASLTQPGAVHCNFDDMTARIKAVKTQGYIPIVTFQHLEYYAYTINPFLQVDFRKVADAGAEIVSGSQGHQPQAIEFYNGSFLHYGLGNLFFDQYKDGFPTRQSFIDRYVFYKGKYISTELITIMFTDLAHSRLMTPVERQDLLQTVFKVSLWPYSQ